MRRTGHLEDVPNYLKKSDEFVGTRAFIIPGLNFCKGRLHAEHSIGIVNIMNLQGQTQTVHRSEVIEK